jgi:hypothetical protein
MTEWVRKFYDFLILAAAISICFSIRTESLTPRTRTLDHANGRSRHFDGRQTHPMPLTTARTSASWRYGLQASNLNEDGKCKFGQKSYWDAMYDGTGDRPSEAYSWYCGYEELKPFWNMLASPLGQKAMTKVLVAGIGNDVTPVDMFDDGWTNMIAFDYSESAVRRAKELFGETRQNATLLTADARKLPLSSNHINATLDKGTLDAIYITGTDVFRDSVAELTRVTACNGVFVCISTVIPSDELMAAFSSSGSWENIHNGDLAFACDGEATIDLGADLYSWRKLGS